MSYFSIIRNRYRKYVGNYKFREAIFFLLIISFFASAPLMWFTRVFGYNFIGAGDFLSPFNFHQQTYSLLFTYNPFIYGGIDLSFLIAQLFPFYAYYVVLHFLGVSSSAITLLFLFFLFLLSEISMFLYLKELLGSQQFKYRYTRYPLSMFGAVIYTLSSYVIGMIQPGHFLELLTYATMPLILLIIKKILLDTDYKLKNFVYLFAIFFLNASSFANFGMIYVTLIILTIYYLAVVFVTKSFFRNIPKYIIIILLPFLSNIWWLLPFFSNLSSTIALNKASSSTTIFTLDLALAKASVLNLFIGKGEGLLFSNLPNSLYDSPFMFLISISLIAFMFYGLFNIKDKKIIIPLLGFIVAGIFISKGTNEPFGGIFLYLYNHFPGFQIFRRPASKFYWVYLFSLVSLGMIGIKLFVDKGRKVWRKILIYFLLTVSIVYLWAIFVFTPLLTPFNVPVQYYQAEGYLTQKKVNKILIIPGFFGTYPTYDAIFNNFYGYDFLNFIWKFSQLVPDSTAYSPNLPYKNKMNEVMSLIREGKSFCNEASNLGITHIMVRKDIALNSMIEDNPYKITALLNNSKDISSRIDYYEKGKLGFSIYTLNKKCLQSSSITLNSSSKNVEYSMVSPVEYKVKLTNIKGGEVLALLNNFSNDWNLYLDGNPPGKYENKNEYTVSSFLENFKEIKLLKDKNYNNNYHLMVNGYANGWNLNINELKKLGEIKKNSDGTYTLYLILFYKTQLYFYIGIIIFAFEILAIISYMLYSFVNRRKF